MTPQEQSLLEEFLGRLQAAGNVNKNVEADSLIHARLDGHPDATYLLVQRCLLVERALTEANAQIATLRQQAATANGGGSFLGGAPDGFGRAPSQTFTPDPRWEQRPPEQPQSMPPGYAQAQPQGWRSRWFGGGGAPAPQAAPAAAAGPSFLGQAATTAAGVAGGMFLFNGIEHLIGGGHNNGNGFGNNSNGLFGNNDGGSLSGPMTENITENVFVDDGRSGGSGGGQGFLDDTDNSSWADNNDYSDDGDNLV